jgi:hypothetical protein
MMVEVVNGGNSKIGLTILTHGFLVSGELIGGRTYFEELGQQIRDSSEDREEGEKLFDSLDLV